MEGTVGGTAGWAAARGRKPVEFRRIALATGLAVDLGIPMKSQTFISSKPLSQHAESDTHAHITARTWLSIRPFDNFSGDFINAPLNRSMIGATWTR